MSAPVRVLTDQQVADALDPRAIMRAPPDAVHTVATGDCELSPKYHFAVEGLLHLQVTCEVATP